MVALELGVFRDVGADVDRFGLGRAGGDVGVGDFDAGAAGQCARGAEGEEGVFHRLGMKPIRVCSFRARAGIFESSSSQKVPPTGFVSDD